MTTEERNADWLRRYRDGEALSSIGDSATPPVSRQAVHNAIKPLLTDADPGREERIIARNAPRIALTKARARKLISGGATAVGAARALGVGVTTLRTHGVKSRPVGIPVTVNGVDYPSRRAAAMAHGLTPDLASNRVRLGWAAPDAVSIPAGAKRKT